MYNTFSLFPFLKLRIMMKKAGFLIFFWMYFTNMSQAQYSSFESAEDSLAQWSSYFLNRESSSQQKEIFNQKFTSLLSELLLKEESDSYSFSKLKSISMLRSGDNKCIVFTWFTFHEKGYQAHGLVRGLIGTKNKRIVSTLNENISDPLSLIYKTLDPASWIGMLYYDLIEFRHQGKPAYLLLGFHGNNGITHKKVIDVLSFSQKGGVRFGLPVFTNGKRFSNRVVFEYKANAKMSLRYNDKIKTIVFDHLSPEKNGLEGQYQYYVPDFSYDGYHFEKKKWTYKKDLELKNDSENSGKEGVKYNLPLPDEK
jgi:hypothetical protein